MKCAEEIAAEVLHEVLADLVPLLDHTSDVHITVSRTSVGISGFTTRFGTETK